MDNKYAKTWVNLSPDMLNALEELAESHGVSLQALITQLVNEALAHRLKRRN